MLLTDKKSWHGGLRRKMTPEAPRDPVAPAGVVRSAPGLRINHASSDRNRSVFSSLADQSQTSRARASPAPSMGSRE